MDLSILATGIVRILGVTALVILSYSIVIRNFPKGWKKGAAVGVLFAVGAILSMNDPVTIAPGVFFDGRTALLAIVYPYGGPIGTVIAAVLIAGYRIWLGGIGAVPGLASITLLCIISYAMTRIPVRKIPIGIGRSVLTGLAASISIVSVLLLPEQVVETIIGPPLIAIVVANILNVVIIVDFLEREKSRLRIIRALEHEASVDPLTKLQNRRAFDKAALRAMNDNRANSTHCSLIMIDIDHFKTINDRLGHYTGDTVLADVAAIIQKNVRLTDVVVRYGGEEILLLLTDTEQDVANELAERVRSEIENTDFLTGQESVHVTVSAGVASLGDKYASMEALLKAADKALYHAKLSGRNRVEVA
ncbi:diguanylate cyclase [Phyllobacterium sp. YR531]|uniref:GGDEF domain-containing protein n=1 Tax=Phyllobacterium sp. YR531 TaxID=1144343 RepID=UPI00026FCC4C|nr:diguanylate cyclase [Phyllobacterium sp. YR531]EJN02391.1 diguanylate cyclase (GGDEF) domain-containing protein [Phyllobacterium sp. YR531]